MSRRATLNLVRLLVLVALLLVVVAQALSWPADDARQRLRNLLAQALAEQTEREVQVGELGGNLLTGFYVTHLAIAPEEGFSRGVEIAARRVDFDMDLRAVWRGETAPAAAVKLIRIQQLYAKLDLSEEGQEKLKKLSKPKAKRPPPEDRFQPLIQVRDAVIDLEGAKVGDRLLFARLVDVQATIKVNAVGPLRARLTARGELGLQGRLSAEILSDDQEDALLVRGTFTGLPLTSLAAALGPAGTALRSGTADARFSFWTLPREEQAVGPLLELLPEGAATPEREKDTGFFADLALHGLGVSGAPLGGAELWVPEARLRVCPEGLEVVDLRGSLAGAALDLDGWVYNLKHPCADLDLRLTGLDLAAARRLVPATAAAGLPPRLSGVADLAAELSGPLDHLSARLQLRLPSGTVVDTREVRGLRLGSLVAEAQLWDSGDPAVVADFAGEQISLPPETMQALVPSSPATQLAALETAAVAPASAAAGEAAEEEGVAEATPPRPRPELAAYTLTSAAAFRGRLLSAGKHTVAEATLSGLSGSAYGVPLEGGEARLALVGDVVRARSVQADLLGGKAVAEVYLRLAAPGRPLRALANVRLAGLHLDRLPEPTVLSLGMRFTGKLSAELAAQWQDNRGEGVARLDVAGVRSTHTMAYDTEEHPGVWAWRELSPDEPAGYPLQDGQVLALLQGDSHGGWRAEVPLARLGAPGLATWVHATGGNDQPWDVVADLGGLDLASLPVGGDKPAGRAYGQVRFQGTPQHPVLGGELLVFDAAFQQYRFGAVLVEFEVRPETLEMKSFLPLPREGRLKAYLSYDTAVASADLSIAPPRDENEAPPLAGQVEITGLRLGQLHELAPAQFPEDLQLRGLARLTARLGGTTLQPVADGELVVSGPRYRDYYADTLRVPVHAALYPDDDEYLTIKGGTLSAGGAQIAFDAVLRNAFEDWNADLTARATNVHLERLSFVQARDLPLAGEVLLPTLKLHATREGVTGEGRLNARDILVGESHVTAVDTHFLVKDDVVTVDQAHLQAAGGEIGATLSYGLQDHRTQAHLRLQHLQVPGLLRLLAPLAAVTPLEGYDTAQLSREFYKWGVRSEGVLSGDLDLQGPPHQLAGDATFELSKGWYLGRPLPHAQGTLGLDLASRTLRNIDVTLALGDASMFITGEAQIGGRMAITADASSVDLATLSEWLPRKWELGGIAGITVVAEGLSASPEVTASVEAFPLSVRGLRFDLLQVPELRLSDAGLDVNRLVLKRGQREITGFGHLPFSWSLPGVPGDQPVNFQARLEKAELGFFPPLIDELLRSGRQGEAAGPTIWTQTAAAGEVNSRLAVSGTLERPVVDGYLDLSNGRVNRPGWLHPLTDLNLRLSARNAGGANQVQVEQAGVQWDQARFTASGEMEIKSLLPDQLTANHYDLALSATASRQGYGALVPLQDLKGQLKLVTQDDGQQLLTVDNLFAQAGAGSLSGGGWVELRSFVPGEMHRNDFQLKLDAHRAQLEYPKLFKGELNGQLTMSNPGPTAPARLSGTLVLSHAGLGLPNTKPPPGPVTYYAPGTGFPDFGLDLRLAVGEDVRLSTTGLVAPITRNEEAVVLQGSVQSPRLRAQFDAPEAVARIPGGDFVLRDAGLTLTAAPASGERHAPRRLEFGGKYYGRAEQSLSNANVDGVDVGPVRIMLAIGGEPPGRPDITVSSEPVLTMDQIVRLMGLQSFTGEGTGDFSQLLSERFVSLLATGFREMFLSPIEEEIRKVLGLSEFTLYWSFDEPVELRVGKYLIKDLRWTYRLRNLGTGLEEWEMGLAYELPLRFRVAFSTNDRGEEQFRISHTWTF